MSNVDLPRRTPAVRKRRVGAIDSRSRRSAPEGSATNAMRTYCPAGTMVSTRKQAAART